MTTKDFRYLRPGDVVVRLLSSARIPSSVTVERISEDRIYCVGGWEFDVATGVEIDDEIGFGPQYGTVASWLVHGDGTDLFTLRGEDGAK